MKIFSVDLIESEEKLEVSVSCDGCVAIEDRLEFAYYLFRNGVKIHTEWYKTASKHSFSIETSPGYYQVLAFAKTPDGDIDQKFSAPIFLNPKVIDRYIIDASEMAEAMILQRNGWKIPLLYYPGRTKELYVLTPSAVDRNARNLPSFSRFTWAGKGLFQGSVIAISDPTLELDEELVLGWCLGTRESDLSDILADFIANLANVINVAPRDVIFWGSSAGGFAALALAERLRGSTAVAINAQTQALDYGDYDQVALIRRRVFGGMSPSEIVESYPHRVNMIHLRKCNGRARIVLIQNKLDHHHFDKHFIPYWTAIGGDVQSGWNEANGNLAFIYDDPRGHVAEDESMAADIIRKISYTRPEKIDSTDDYSRPSSHSVETNKTPSSKPEKEILFTSESLEVSYREHYQSKGTVVTFSYLHWGKKREFGFSEQYWLELGYSVASIQSEVNYWFNDLPHEIVLSVAARIRRVDGLPVVAYGASMGGFAALALRGELGATHAIAFSPQFSVKNDFDDRWADCFEGEHRHSIKGVTTHSVKCLVLYDPFSKDSMHIDRIQAVAPDIELMALPNSGHQTSLIMNEIKLLDQCQNSFLSGQGVKNLITEFKSNRRYSDTFLLGLGWKLGGRRWTYAVHARYVIAKIKESGIEHEQLTRAIEERFFDVGRWLRSSDAIANSKLKKSENFELLIERVKASVAPRTSSILTTSDTSLSNKSPSSISTQGYLSLCQICVPAAGRYRVDIPLRSAQTFPSRFVDVTLTGDALPISATVPLSVLDTQTLFAFNSSGKIQSAIVTDKSELSAVVFFDARTEGNIEISIRCRQSFSGIF